MAPGSIWFAFKGVKDLDLTFSVLQINRNNFSSIKIKSKWTNSSTRIKLELFLNNQPGKVGRLYTVY